MHLGRKTALALGLVAVLAASFLVAFYSHPGARTPSAATPALAPSTTPTSTYSPGTTTSGQSSPTAEPRVGKPNLMFVLMDDMRADDLRWMPRTRRLMQARGLNFKNSFSPFPLCCPARASVVTGEAAHNHRVLYHDEPYGFGSLDDSRSLATAMQQAGYSTGFTGKYLNLYGRQDSLVTGKSSIPYVPAGWSEWRAGLDTLWGPGSPYQGNTYDYYSFTQNVNGRTTSNRGEYSSHVIADDAIEMAAEFGRQQRPWFLWVNPVAPHHGNPIEPDDPGMFYGADGFTADFSTPARPPWVWGKFDKQIRHPIGVPPRGPTELDVSDKPANIRRFPELSQIERLRLTEVNRQRAESLYAWDVEFGRIVRSLKRTGQWRRTIVFFSSDNGFFLGEHRQRTGKIKPYEPSIRVPLLVAGPGVPRGVRYQPITTYDVTSTLLDIAGAPPKALPKQDGQSKADVIFGADRPWTYPVITEGLLTGVARRQPGFDSGLTEIGLRTGRWKYLRYANGDRELYDLYSDPLELHSLHRDPAYRDLMQRFAELWRFYKDCQQSQCQQPLPADLRVGIPALKRQLAFDAAERRRYYGTQSRPR